MAVNLDPTQLDLSTVPTWVWYLLLIVGILLCFFGEIIWEFMVSILGAIIGSMIGFAVGYVIGGPICAFGLMFIFAIIGSMLFQVLAKVAVALICAILAFGGAAYLTYTANPDDSSTPVIVGLIVGVVIFFIAVMYVEEIVGVFLAAIGGFLIAVGVYFLIEGDMAVIFAGLAGGLMFGLGAVFQVMYQRQRKESKRPPPRREPVRETRPAGAPTRQRPPTGQKPPTTPTPQKPPTTPTPQKPPAQGPKPPDSSI